MSPTNDASDGKPTNHAPPSDAAAADSIGQADVQARILNEIALHLVAELDMETLVQRVTDVATEVTGARFGAFFYTSTENGEALLLYSLSGAPREAFQKFGAPRNTAIFAPTFHGEGVVRLDDVQADPRYGQNAPHYGMPEGHLPVRSYLAVPVVSRGGNVLGGLFLGHPEIARFDRRAEQAAVAVAAYAAIAIDNARLFEQANREIRERTSVEATLSEAEARFHAVAMNAPAAVYIKDRAGRYVVANRVASEALGRPDGAAGFTDHDLLTPEAADRLREHDQEVLSAGRALELDETVTRDGFERRYLSVKFPVQDGEGNVYGIGGVSIDITERKRIESALHDAIAEQRRADDRKDEFLATLAHELRNPLAPIRYGLEIVKAASSREESREAIAMMERQLQQLIRLVDDLLDINRIGRGAIELHTELVDVGEIIDSAIETSRPLIEENAHCLNIERPDDPMFIEADPVRMSEVVSNLLNNAAKYTSRGGDILVRAEHESREAVITVADNGIGMEPDFLARAFEMFVRRERAGGSGGGLGIGLTIAQRLVALHGGSISAHSEGLDRGSRFTIRLPLAESRAVPGAPVASNPPARPQAMRVLVVDDNVDSALSLSLLLQRSGYETLTAHSGADAIDIATTERPDAALLDVGMPDIDGYEVCRRLRRAEGGRDMLIVAVTGWGLERDKQRSREAGFDDHVVKPVQPALLDELLTRERRARGY